MFFNRLSFPFARKLRQIPEKSAAPGLKSPYLSEGFKFRKLGCCMISGRCFLEQAQVGFVKILDSQQKSESRGMKELSLEPVEPFPTPSQKTCGFLIIFIIVEYTPNPILTIKAPILP